MAKRYCAMCDTWMTAKICPACGMDTRVLLPSERPDPKETAVSGGICLWNQKWTGTWDTTCGGRSLNELPHPGRSCPYCGMTIVIDDGIAVSQPVEKGPPTP